MHMWPMPPTSGLPTPWPSCWPRDQSLSCHLCPLSSWRDCRSRWAGTGRAAPPWQISGLQLRGSGVSRWTYTGSAVPAGNAGGRDHQGHSLSQLSVPPPRWRLAQRGAIPCLQPQDAEQGVCAHSEVPSGAATVQGMREVYNLQRGVRQDGRPLAQLQQGRWRDDSEGITH